MSAAVLGQECERYKMAARRQVQPTTRMNEGPSIIPATDSINSTDPAVDAAFDLPKFKKVFDRAYNDWFQTTCISPDLRTAVESQDVSIELFEKLTLNRQYQRYITLVEGRIRFDELPNAPHGEIVGCVIGMIMNQTGGTGSRAIFGMSSDNGLVTSRFF